MNRVESVVSVLVFFMTFIFSCSVFAEAEAKSVTPEGFQLEGGLDAAFIPIGSGLSGGVSGPSFMVGYRLDRLTFGVDLSAAMSSSDDGQGNEGRSRQSIYFAPTVRYDVVSADNGRSRLHVLGSAGYGTSSFERTYQPSGDSAGDGTTETVTSDTTTTHIPIEAGIGGEHFFTEHLALGFEAGFQLDILTTDRESNGGTGTGGGLGGLAGEERTSGSSYGFAKILFVF